MTTIAITLAGRTEQVEIITKNADRGYALTDYAFIGRIGFNKKTHHMSIELKADPNGIADSDGDRWAVTYTSRINGIGKWARAFGWADTVAATSRHMIETGL